MKRLEIDLSEAQYQHIMEEIRYAGRIHLEEETLGGYELTLLVGIPDIVSFLEMKMTSRIALGEVNWRFKDVREAKSEGLGKQINR